jgi:D-glycerate 3-kinase
MPIPSLSKADLTQSFVAHASAVWRSSGRPVVVGLCGAQGSGKSTLTEASKLALERQGIRTAIVALDDFYLPRQARIELSSRIHPLLLTRGVPGTHDTDMLAGCLQQLVQPGFCDLPRFDKAEDTRAETTERIRTPVDIVLFEGWCVGARPQPDAELETPVNRLEAEEDQDGVWRNFVQAQLGGPYRNLFASLDALALLKAPSFEVVFSWRKEQEDALRARTGRGMSDVQLIRFIAHYERLTRWILSEMPERADWCFPLDELRRWLPD